MNLKKDEKSAELIGIILGDGNLGSYPKEKQYASEPEKISFQVFNKKPYIYKRRGLFDTDGCCYKTGKEYLIINFTNLNITLLKGIYKALEYLDFHPYIKRSGRDVELGRQLEVSQFFSIIVPRNLKHYRFRQGSQLGDGGRLKNVRSQFDSEPCHKNKVVGNV